MKRIIFALAVSATILVSCHQPSKEEQLKEQVMVVFNDYAKKENLAGKWSIDRISFDTAGNSYRYAVSMRDVLKMLADFDADLVTQVFLNGDVLSDIKKGQNITNELDTSLIVVAVVHTTQYVKNSSPTQFVFYCGIRHGTIHTPQLSGDDALKDIHKPSEQAIYNACEDVAIKMQNLRMFLAGHNNFLTCEDSYNLWVNRAYRIDPRKLD